MRLQASSRDIDISEVISCELSPAPTALFDDSGKIRIFKSKAELKNLNKVEVAARQPTQEATCTVIDGCVLLWIPQWPISSSTQKPIANDFVEKFKHHIKEKLNDGDTHLVFNRYKDFSTKTSTRTSRMAERCKVFQLSLTSPLPSQKVTLTITQNKKQLIDIICKHIQKNSYFQKNSEKHKLMITSQQKSPVEISCGVVIQRDDIATNQEADNIVVQQAIQVAVNEQKHVNILANDTDVYTFLLYHYLEQGLQLPMTMASPIKERKVIDIRAIVEKQS